MQNTHQLPFQQLLENNELGIIEDPLQRVENTHQLPFQQLLENNELGIIENPLQRVEEDDLDNDIYDFHEDYRLGRVVDVGTLKHGAHLARDEEATSAILNDVEKQALEREQKTRFWEESKELKVILLTCCVGSVVQGWAQGAIVGANTRWPAEFGLHVGHGSPGDPQSITGDIWRFSATNAIVYFSASCLGAFLCDPMTEIFWGRQGALFVAAIMTFAASVGQAFTHSWQALFACRVLLGLGMGAKSSIVPVFEAEVSPARLRGQVLTSWQTGTALGIAFSAAIPLIVPNSWRFQISSSFIPAAILLALVYVGSESPRWLVKKQRYAEAYTVLLRLREHPLLAARDLVHIRAQLNVETILFMRSTQNAIDLGNQVPRMDEKDYKRQISLFGYGRRIVQLFSIPRVRRSTLASFIVMSAQIMCGINIFAFLATTLFDYAGFSPTDGQWLFFGFGLSNFASSVIAYFYIDSKGRRFLLMVSLAAMFPLLLASGFSYEIESISGKIAAVTTFLIIYTLAYSPGAGVVPFLYSSEIFPQILREVGMASASAVVFFGAGILDLIVPQLIHAIGQTALLGLFAGLDFIALILVWLFVPGTERHIATMEEMNYVFGVSTRTHTDYQVKQVAPWWYARYIRRRNVKELPSLYRWAKLRDRTAGNVSASAGTRAAGGDGG